MSCSSCWRSNSYTASQNWHVIWQEPWTVNFYPEGGDVGIIEIILKKS